MATQLQRLNAQKLIASLSSTLSLLLTACGNREATLVARSVCSVRTLVVLHVTRTTLNSRLFNVIRKDLPRSQDGAFEIIE